ncbi:MAG: ATP-binding cassette domain-containing protein [Lachnospiraceae bacterium]|nr:ATP-binding cassette domain-containing protein [Lachnospiraceae bacterium]
MLQVQNVSITLRKDFRVILEDFNLVLNDGDKAVMIGEEGNGKSTLLKWIYDPELVEGYADVKGVRSTGNELLGYLPQELPAEDRNKSVYEFFSENDVFWSETPKDLALLAKKYKVADDFFYSEQKMETLSGGEKIKAELMRLLMQEPTILLLDEPSNDIDIATLELLEELIRERKHAVLYISHDETLIERTANMVVHIEQIARKTRSRYTVVHMPYREYVEDRLGRFERQAQQAANDRKEKKARDEKYKRVLNSVDHALGTATRQNPAAAKNLKDKMHSVKSMGRRFAREDESMTEMPEMEEAIFFKLGGEKSAIPAGKTVLEFREDELISPDGEKVLARDIFLRVRGPEKVCIVGTNGAGKTTLLRQIAKQLLARDDICAEYMPQNYSDLLDPTKTPVDFLNISGDKDMETRIRTYLGSLKFTFDEMDHPMGELSGGQRAKVFLLKMSLSDANVLILDEPTRNFSPLSLPVIRQMLRNFPGAIISVSHDRKYIGDVCDTVYRLTEKCLSPDN